jgi:hypothetical protein
MDICFFSPHLMDEAEDDNTEWKERRGEGEREGKDGKDKEGEEYQKWFVETARIDEGKDEKKRK